MKIGYKEILDLYNQGDSFFICHTLREAFGDDINSEDFVKAVGIDMYGPIIGRLKYWFEGGGELECTYPGIQLVLARNTRAVPAVGHGFRLELLAHLAETHPERKFDVQYFL